MAYSLESLIRILEQVLHRPPDYKLWTLDRDKKPQLEALLAKACSLKLILEELSPVRTEGVESQIRDAAHEAEDIIESHLVDQMLLNPGGDSSFVISPPDLQKAIVDMDAALGLVANIRDGAEAPGGSLPCFVPVNPEPGSKNILVGLDEDLMVLKDRLTGQQPRLEILPIVGMGGIGKTTLARYLYDDKLIVSHFDTFAWVAISQEYNVRDILIGLIGCVNGKLNEDVLRLKNNQLGVTLHKSLIGRRYLIVLDDMWSAKAWDDIKMFLPKENRRSRILLTTRDLDVAKYVGSSSWHHQMHLLNKVESWNLLRQSVFGEEKSDRRLDMVGEKIARHCGGLPLAINVIGGILRDTRTADFWERVARDVISIVNENDERIFKIMLLSYNHLPHHLRPCFLYMGAFPEDQEIRASKLIKLWVAEGFLKSVGDDKTLEETAEEHLMTLVDRNLLLVHRRKSIGKVKSYGIHDVLRDLCVRIAARDNFLYVKNCQVHKVEDGSLNSLRRVSVHPSYRIRDVYASTELMSLARTFLCVGPASRAILSPVFFALRLLRVLDVFDIEFHQFPNEILQLVNLRYLAFSCNSPLPSAVSRFRNLQTLIVQSNLRSTDIPCAVLEMPELRHVKFKKTIICLDSECGLSFVHEKLQKISYINAYELIQSNFLRNIPNVRNLGINYYALPADVIDLQHLHKLETLKCWSRLPLNDNTFLPTLKFPPSLRKLTLTECIIPREFVATVGSLPDLEVLKIRNCEFEGWEMGEKYWDTTDGGFCSLRFLLLEKLTLVRWRADETHFPRLRQLVIRDCAALEDIPCGIGEIPTLEVIECDESNPGVVASARQIQEIQRDYGNNSLEVRIIH